MRFFVSKCDNRFFSIRFGPPEMNVSISPPRNITVNLCEDLSVTYPPIHIGSSPCSARRKPWKDVFFGLAIHQRLQHFWQPKHKLVHGPNNRN